MKNLKKITSISSIVIAIVALVSMILFLMANSTSNGTFNDQYESAPYVVTFTILILVCVALVIALPFLPINKKVTDFAIDVCVIAIVVFMCLVTLYVCKASVYEMSLTWGSELHAGEPFMFTASKLALTSAIMSFVGGIAYGISSCFTLKGE